MTSTKSTTKKQLLQFEEISKLATIAEAGRKLAEAADALKLTPEELSGIVIAYANKLLSK